MTPWTVGLPGSFVNGILQARILDWVAIPFSRESSQPRDQTWVFHIEGRFHQGSHFILTCQLHHLTFPRMFMFCQEKIFSAKPKPNLMSKWMTLIIKLLIWILNNEFPKKCFCFINNSSFVLRSVLVTWTWSQHKWRLRVNIFHFSSSRTCSGQKYGPWTS